MVSRSHVFAARRQCQTTLFSSLRQMGLDNHLLLGYMDSYRRGRGRCLPPVFCSLPCDSPLDIQPHTVIVDTQSAIQSKILNRCHHVRPAGRSLKYSDIHTMFWKAPTDLSLHVAPQQVDVQHVELAPSQDGHLRRTGTMTYVPSISIGCSTDAPQVRVKQLEGTDFAMKDEDVQDPVISIFGQLQRTRIRMGSRHRVGLHIVAGFHSYTLN
ncbi:hypothetical protein BDZ85DRAFT_12374 [Elsinoe ampelina]|uniref:Uncharacterized protein n=1 Tax=Elsinoe ampelina TaxID=302913 RepID=A0A6A6GRM1_9PEZI|nr:hypothetical protein BDZ85DRAFT_12374 [Elsinoe ampelina]